MFSIITSSTAQTEEVGRVLGSLLRQGDLVCLYGDLGAGKTHLAYGIALGLEVGEHYVTSPTFTFVNEYQGRIPFYHIDLYRMRDPSELEGIGFEEYVDSDGATVIEWAERAGNELPPECLSVYLSDISVDSREIGFLAEGDRFRTLLKELRERLQERSIGNRG